MNLEIDESLRRWKITHPTEEGFVGLAHARRVLGTGVVTIERPVRAEANISTVDESLRLCLPSLIEALSLMPLRAE